LEQAIETFSKKFAEPLRLWEAYNEIGSLLCDWGWLARSQAGNYEFSLRHYDAAIAYQLKAKEVAEQHDLEAQLLDSLDDLAQDYGDRSILLVSLNQSDVAAQDRKRAEQHLAQVANLVHESFKLAPGKGFPGGLVDEQFEGNTQWLAMGKKHLWQDIWLFRDLENELTSRVNRDAVLEEAMENLFLSSAYFRRYWATSFDYDRAIGYLTEFLPKSGVRLDQAQKQIEAVEKKYAIHLPELHDLVSRTLLY
jgi:tetratricopeptide (TPR) repeat protein